MPPTWDWSEKKQMSLAEHYGLEVWVHFGVGPDEQSYICLEKHNKGPCPVCEKGRKAAKHGDEEYAKSCKPNKRVAVWWIDRAHEADGPKVYIMPWTLDRDFAALCFDEDTGDTVSLDHPDEGYDIRFKRTGKGRQTKYIGIKLSMRSSPLSDSPKTQRKWLAYILKHPLPKCLNFYEYDHISATLNQTSKMKKDDDGPKTRAEKDGGGKVKKFNKKKHHDDGGDDPFAGKSKKKSKLGKEIKKGLKKSAA